MSKHRYPKIYSNGLLIIFWLKSQFWGKRFWQEPLWRVWPGIGHSSFVISWYRPSYPLYAPKKSCKNLGVEDTAWRVFYRRTNLWGQENTLSAPASRAWAFMFTWPKDTTSEPLRGEGFQNVQNPKISSDHLTEHPRPSFCQPITNMFNYIIYLYT